MGSRDLQSLKCFLDVLADPKIDGLKIANVKIFNRRPVNGAVDSLALDFMIAATQ